MSELVNADDPFGPAEEAVFEWELTLAEEEAAERAGRLTVSDIDAFHVMCAQFLSRSDVPPHIRDKVRYLMKRVDECYSLTQLETPWNVSRIPTSR